MLTVRRQQHSVSTHERMFLWKCLLQVIIIDMIFLLVRLTIWRFFLSSLEFVNESYKMIGLSAGIIWLMESFRTGVWEN